MKRKNAERTASHPSKCCVPPSSMKVCNGRQDARPHHKFASANPSRGGQDACATKNFVINYLHDPCDRVAGDVSQQRDDRVGSGSIEQF
jgi:hypothetical protein